MKERTKSLRTMNIIAAVLFGLIVLIYVYILSFPEEIAKLFMRTTDITLSKEAVLYLLTGIIKPMIFTAIGIIGFRRKNMSYKYSLITAVGSGILYLFPPAFIKLYITNIFVRFFSMEQWAYMNALNSAIAMFGFISTIGILLIFGSALAEAYAVKYAGSIGQIEEENELH